MDKALVPLVFIGFIIVFLIWFGAIANSKPKLWWLGAPLFIVGMAISVVAMNDRSTGAEEAQWLGALIGLPFIVGFFGQKLFGNAPVIARFVGSLAGAGGAAAVMSFLSISPTNISVTSILVGVTMMAVTSLLGGA